MAKIVAAFGVPRFGPPNCDRDYDEQGRQREQQRRAIAVEERARPFPGVLGEPLQIVFVKSMAFFSFHPLRPCREPRRSR